MFAKKAPAVSNALPGRKQIVELLQLLALEEQQLAYERDVSQVDITAELVCMWFDDQYSPGQGFDNSFSPDELVALDEFHRFFDERVAHLPASQGTVRTWLVSSVWRDVMEQARRTLERLTASSKAL